MEEFKVEKETKTVSQKGRNKRVLTVLLGLAAGAGMFLTAACDILWWNTGGEPTTITNLTYPDFTKEEASAMADTMLSNALGITMEHDKLILLDDGTNAVVFRADGYNASEKIAYEYTASQDYYWQTANDILDYDEIVCISNYSFEGTYIVVLDTVYSNEAAAQIDKFIDWYTNH